jgi:hypothetical protein
MMQVNYTLENNTDQDFMLVCKMEHASSPSVMHLPAGEVVAFFDQRAMTTVKIFKATPKEKTNDNE